MSKNITFQSTYISPAIIQKRRFLKKIYKPKTVSFVELNSHCNNDIKAVCGIAKKYEQNDYFKDIYLTMRDAEKDKKFFAIVNRKNKRKVTKRNILGLLQIDMIDSKRVHIDYVHVNPKYINNSDTSSNNIKYKNIGTALLNGICNLFKNYAISLKTYNASAFYEKFGFEGSIDSCRMLKMSK